MKLLILLSVFLVSCGTTSKYVYAPAKISHYKGRVHVQPSGKFKPIPDTVIDGYIIRRVR